MVRQAIHPLCFAAKLPLPVLAWAVLAVVFWPAVAPAQTSWEYSPYRIRVWLAVQPAARLALHEVAELKRSLGQQAERVAGAAWNLEIESPPAALVSLQQFALSEMVAAQVLAADAEAAKADKILLLAVVPGNELWRVQAREFDCRTLALGEMVSHEVAQPSLLPHIACDALADAFTPVARMESPKGNDVRLKLRAGGLVIDTHSPAAVNPGHLMQPVLRQNDRKGQVRPGGIRTVPFTYVRVEENREGRVAGQLVTGARSMLGSRGSGRTERLAVLVKPRGTATTLVVKTPDRTPPGQATLPGRTLAGYRIAERVEAGGPLVPLGLTDWQGRFAVDFEPARPIRELFVANGELPLARMPLVPGHQPSVAAVLNDDDPRIEAEGFVLAFQGRVLDILVQRTELVARAKRRIGEGKPDEAKALLQRLRELPNRSQLTATLEMGERRVMAEIPKGAVEKKVAKMFEEARKQLATFLATDPADEVAAALRGEAKPAPQASEEGASAP